MRKICCLLAVLLVVLCGCNIQLEMPENKHPIAIFGQKLEEANSCQMLLSRGKSYTGEKITMKIKVDGNAIYFPSNWEAGVAEQYFELREDGMYHYTKDKNGNWQKNKVELSEEDSTALLEDDLAGALFNPDNYEPVEGEENTYQQKEDVELTGCRHVKMTVNEENCIIQMYVTFEGETRYVRFMISQLGDITVTLPEVE